MPRRLQMKQEKIQAYLLRVNKLSGVVYKGYLAEVDNTLEAEQRYVNFNEANGLIAVVSINNDIDIICNDEGKIRNFPINRFLVSDDGIVLDMLVGNIMCVRHNSAGEFTSIREEDIPVIESHLIPLMPDKMIDYGYIKEHSEWGNGNSFDVIEGESDNPWSFKSVVVTDQNGYADMYLPAQCKYGDYEGDYPNVYVGGSANAVLSAQGSRNAYISNGLVDVTIDDEYYTNTKTLGIEPTFGALGTDYDKILGDYYDAKKLSKKSSNTVTLKDTTRNDIAVVTMGIKETADIHLLGKDGETYKVTGLEPVVDIKMADGVTDWTVSVTSDDNNNADNTLHINAVKSGTAVSSDSYTVDLGDSQTISADTFASILAENATKDVIIKSNNNVTFTFAKGTMASVDGKTEYDFSTSIVNAYADTMPSYITKDNFVSQINYNYSGKLPATANIRFYAGTEYAGQTLYYSLMNADNTFAEVQAVVVDADGYMTVKQDHCSSYVVTKTEPKLPSNDDTKTDNGNTSNNGNTSTSDNNTSSGNTTVSTDKNASSANTTATSPKTGDMTPIAIYVVMAFAAMGVIVFVKRRKTA